MNTKYIIVAIAIFGSLDYSAQTVISAGSVSSQSTNVSLEGTIGEPITHTYTGTNAALTQGFQQSGLEVVGVIENETFQISIYPNPTVNYLTISSDNTLIKSIIIIDLNGKILVKNNEIVSTWNYDLSDLSNGTYLVKVENEKQILNTYKIIKTK